MAVRDNLHLVFLVSDAMVTWVMRARASRYSWLLVPCCLLIFLSSATPDLKGLLLFSDTTFTDICLLRLLRMCIYYAFGGFLSTTYTKSRAATAASTADSTRLSHPATLLPSRKRIVLIANIQADSATKNIPHIAYSFSFSQSCQLLARLSGS